MQKYGREEAECIYKTKVNKRKLERRKERQEILVSMASKTADASANPRQNSSELEKRVEELELRVKALIDIITEMCKDDNNQDVDEDELSAMFKQGCRT